MKIKKEKSIIFSVVIPESMAKEIKGIAKKELRTFVGVTRTLILEGLEKRRCTHKKG